MCSWGSRLFVVPLCSTEDACLLQTLAINCHIRTLSILGSRCTSSALPEHGLGVSGRVLLVGYASLRWTFLFIGKCLPIPNTGSPVPRANRLWFYRFRPATISQAIRPLAISHRLCLPCPAACATRRRVMGVPQEPDGDQSILSGLRHSYVVL